MGKVIAEISMSVDGVVAGTDTSTEHRLGKDGGLLHDWMFEGTDAHRPAEPLVKGPTTFTFVTDGPESALRQAKAAAGDENVVVMGGGTTMRQFLRAGLVDELRLHVVPLLFGAGVRLFDAGIGEHVKLERTAVHETPNATHLTFRVLS